MQRRIILVVGVALAICIGYFVFLITGTKRYSPRDIAKYTNDSISLSIEYGRPYKKGRLLFGYPGSNALEFYGEHWRTGANEATEITVSRDLVFPEGILKAGSYSVYSVPGENDWTIAFNSKLSYWGADITGSPFDPALDALRVTVPRIKSDSVIEQFTIDFEEIDQKIKMLLLWDDIRLEVPITTTDEMT